MTFTFEGEARELDGGRIAVWTDGVGCSTDNLPAAAWRFEEGKRYKIIIEELQKPIPKKKYLIIQKNVPYSVDELNSRILGDFDEDTSGTMMIIDRENETIMNNDHDWNRIVGGVWP